QPSFIRKRNTVENAAAKKCVRQTLFGIAGHNHYGPEGGFGPNLRLSQFRDPEVEPLDLVENIVGEITRCLVDFIDKHHRPAPSRMFEARWEQMTDLVGFIGEHYGTPECIEAQE